MADYDYVTGTIDSARRQADRVVSPDDRQKAYDSVNAFAHDRPLLFVSPSSSLLAIHSRGFYLIRSHFPPFCSIFCPS